MQIHAGIIPYESSDIQATITKWYNAYKTMMTGVTVPPELYIQPMIMSPPGQGITFIGHFVWAGPPSDESQAWLDRVIALGTAFPNTVAAATPGDYVRELPNKPICIVEKSGYFFMIFV